MFSEHIQNLLPTYTHTSIPIIMYIHTITSTANPSMNALTKSAAFWIAPGSEVNLEVCKRYTDNVTLWTCSMYSNRHMFTSAGEPIHGRLQSLEWTGELDWWIDIFRITFRLSSQTHLPVGLYMQYINLETQLSPHWLRASNGEGQAPVLYPVWSGLLLLFDIE